MQNEQDVKTPEIVPKSALVPMAPNRWSLVPSSLGEAREIATLIAASDFAPRDYKGKPNNVLIAIQMGADVGLKPMQALQNIAVINGRPSIWGDAALALVQAGNVLERFHETYEGTEGTDGFKAVCVAKRRGFPDEYRNEFSIGDAKAAGLWGKQGPWTTYPKRMLKFRARGFTLRDAAPDLLLGLVLAEEALDTPPPYAAGSDTVEGEVVAPYQAALDKVSDDLKASIEKAFATLDETGGFSPAQRHTKLNEFLAGDGDPETQAAALVEWCRDEYARRKFGQPRAPKGDNGKQAPPASQTSVPPSTPAGGDQGSRPSGAEPLGVPDTPQAPSSDRTPPATAMFGHDTNKPPKGELF